MLGPLHLGVVFRQVNLRHFRPSARAGVGHIKRDGGRSIGPGSHLQIGKSKRRVGKAKSKGKQRRGLVLLVSAITHKDAFLVLHLLAARRGIVIRECGVVLRIAFKRGRQMP